MLGLSTSAFSETGISLVWLPPDSLAQATLKMKAMLASTVTSLVILFIDFTVVVFRLGIEVSVRK